MVINDERNVHMHAQRLTLSQIHQLKQITGHASVSLNRLHPM